MGQRTINKKHRWWGVLPGPQATPYVVLLRVRVRKKEPRKYSERGRATVVVAMCVCVCVCVYVCVCRPDAQSVNFGSHPVWRVPPPSQSREDYTRTETRKSQASADSFSVRSLACFPLRPAHHTPLTTCVARFIPRELCDVEGLLARRKFSEKTSVEGKKIARAITLPLCFVSTGKQAAPLKG